MSRNIDIADEHDDIMYPSTLPFILLHVSSVAAFWTGIGANRAQGLSLVDKLGSEAAFQVGDGGRHDSRLRPRSQSPWRALDIFL